MRNYSIVGVHWGYIARLYEEEMVRIHHTLCDMYDEGQINPLIYEQFSFDEVPHALLGIGRRMESWL
ncbi:hypothetical protein [Natribacillus halophilus]|uniref:hypothetical protein n=1 Tax=Natribacillus halophilus TaxID=549003 RepID=UPI001FE0B905|nr:hypothetical protein [Natribacillus halophilus]